MRSAILWGALVVLASCGSNRPEINTTQDSVCDDVAEVACFDLYQCCAEGEIERALGVSDARTQAQCFDDVHAVCERRIGTFDFSLKNKHVRFDAKLMNSCLEAFVAPDDACATISPAKPWTEACMDSAWVGIVEAGGTCDFAYECVEGSYCNTSRVCAALPTEGQPCATPGCADGLFCNAGTCRALGATGSACQSTTQCQDGLYCDTAAAAPTCMPVHAVGEPCTGTDSCESKTCLPGTCAGTQDTCTSDAGCGAGRCADDNSTCFGDSGCAAGTCSGTATTCFSQFDCTTAGSTCVFPVRCILTACQGRTCADAHIAVDYCQGPITELPLFAAPRIGVGGGAGGGTSAPADAH